MNHAEISNSSLSWSSCFVIHQNIELGLPVSIYHNGDGRGQYDLVESYQYQPKF